VLANNSELAPHIPSCQYVESFNSYVCTRDYLSMLVFESLDAYKQDRAMQPIYVQQQGTEMKNNLNGFMDHCWDGFYTCHKRLQRFPSVIDAAPTNVYNLTFTGTIAKTMRYTIIGNKSDAGVTIRIHYDTAETKDLYKDGKKVNYNSWIEA